MNADLVLVLGLGTPAAGLDDAVEKGSAQWSRPSHLINVNSVVLTDQARPGLTELPRWRRLRGAIPFPIREERCPCQPSKPRPPTPISFLSISHCRVAARTAPLPGALSIGCWKSPGCRSTAFRGPLRGR